MFSKLLLVYMYFYLLDVYEEVELMVFVWVGCISMNINNVEHHFISLLSTQISSVKCLFKSFAYIFFY